MTEKHKQDVQKWELLIKDRLASGMSISQFCKANGCTENMYHHWVSEVHKLDPDFDTGGKSGKVKKEKASSLVEITPVVPINAVNPAVSNTTDTDSRIPVAAIYSGPVMIELYPDVDASFIRSLLEAVLYVQA